MSYFKNFVSLKVFVSDNKYILDIVKYSQLQHTPNWKIWIDIYGNKLIVNDKKKPKIKLQENINVQKIESKDLYFKSHISKLSLINKYSLISIKDNKYYLWMLDINNILRLCTYIDDCLVENQPILNSGIKNLEKIVNNVDVDGWKEVEYITEPLTDSVMDFSVATSWPPKKDLINLLPEIIKKDCNFV